MKTLGEAALELPWIAPSIASLAALSRYPIASVWNQVRTDPGILLLFARCPKLSALDLDISLLENIEQRLRFADRGFVDWAQPGPSVVYRACYRHALLAHRLAESVGCDADEAWIAGFLAPLGWLALTAADSRNIAHHLADSARQPTAWQVQSWGFDHLAIARRLGSAWRLPGWLTSTIGRLGLHVSIAERLGAPPRLFQLLQATAILLQQRVGASDTMEARALELQVGTPLPELLAALRLPAEEAITVADDVSHAGIPTQTWESPAKHPLVLDLVRLALDNRRRDDADCVERLQRELDGMQSALINKSVDDERRLQGMKLSSLAEFAAGAGHEINNPLAVISGQAQYVLKQLAWLDGPAEEIENVGEYLENLRSIITPSLQKIIGQTQRIHSILTEVMQFARPSTPKPQTISVAKLLHDSAEGLRSFAQEHQVELNRADLDSDMWICADPTQARIALGSLWKNAIEAAPSGGWARVRVEATRPGLIDLIVEDNGPGPDSAACEHLFDPFFSGRSAGRGRGMGLSTAWRLARQHGGDVRMVENQEGMTRFVLTLPSASAPPVLNGNAVHAESAAARNGSLAVA